MKFIDLFAGIGGFRRGMELAGHECVGFCEFDKYAVASYTAMHLLTDAQREYINSIPLPLKKNGEPNFAKRQKEIWKEEYRNGEWYANDIRTVDARNIPRAECWCFGFPCQDISIAGNCLGFDGHRSSLFFAVTRLIRDIPEVDRPKYLFVENVKNLLSVNRGLDFARLLIEMDEIGYDAEWSLLNSKDFGVPQNRERVFVIGHLRGRSTRKIFPLRDGESIHNEARTDGEIHKIAQCLTSGGNDKWQGDYIVKQIGNCMPTATRDNPNQGRIYDPTGIGPCLNKMDGGGREPLIPVGRVAIPVLTPDRAEKRQNGRRFKENGEPMFTLTSQDRHGVMIKEATKQGYAVAEEGDSINLAVPNSKTRRGRVGKGIANTLDTSCNQGTLDGTRIRKLTPLECSRLQGWEDVYYERAAMVNSDSQIYKQEWNGVTVPVVYEIARWME